MNKSDNYITVKELQELLPLKITHIYNMIQKKEIPFIKLGGKYLFDKIEINNWVMASKSKVVNNSK